MCEYHGPVGARRGSPSALDLPGLPVLDLVCIDEARLIVLARRLHLRLCAGPLGQRLPDTAAQRLTRLRDSTNSLIRLSRGAAASPALLRPLIEGYESHCSEHERRLWLHCVDDALASAGLPPAARAGLWRWFEILSLRLLHRRAAALATVRYLFPPADSTGQTEESGIPAPLAHP